MARFELRNLPPALLSLLVTAASLVTLIVGTSVAAATTTASTNQLCTDLGNFYWETGDQNG